MTPLWGLSTIFIMRRMFALLMMIRGRPNTLQAGSSGWIAMLISYLSQVGMMRSRKYFRLAKSFSSSTSRYISKSSFIWAMRSGSQPGRMEPLESPLMEANISSGFKASTASWV
ncbi:hypothetical protein IMSAG185_01136 [Lachnospiraceae bacterium]|nr:hypothetical protein IMSAG185_01136 [Lachnospiraceae bacterium]